MTSSFNVVLRPAETKDEEIAQSLLRACEVVFGIQRRQDCVLAHLPVKCANELMETLFSNGVVNFTIVHEQMLARAKSWMAWAVVLDFFCLDTCPTDEAASNGIRF